MHLPSRHSRPLLSLVIIAAVVLVASGADLPQTTRLVSKRQASAAVRANMHQRLQNNVHYHLKWIWDGQTMPVWLETRRRGDLAASHVQPDYRWFKYAHGGMFVDELADYQTQYVYSLTPDAARLYLLAYDYDTHAHLSSYEPRLVATHVRQEEGGDGGGGAAKPPLLPSVAVLQERRRDIFTLAYLKSQAIVVSRSRRKSHIR